MPPISTQLARTKERLSELRPISAGVFAAVCDVNPGQLSNAFKGVIKLNPEVENRLVVTSLILSELALVSAPYWLPNDVDQLKRLLKRVRKNDITPEEIRKHVAEIFGDEQV
jgi:hypothetical protein